MSGWTQNSTHSLGSESKSAVAPCEKLHNMLHVKVHVNGSGITPGNSGCLLIVSCDTSFDHRDRLTDDSVASGGPHVPIAFSMTFSSALRLRLYSVCAARVERRTFAPLDKCPRDKRPPPGHVSPRFSDQPGQSHAIHQHDLRIMT